MYKSEKAAKRARWVLLYKALAIIAGVIVLAAALAALSRSHFVFAEITVTGDTVTEESVLKEKIDDVVDKNWLFLFKRNNLLFFPAGKVKTDLSKEFPRIKEINISFNGLKKIEVAIYEHRGDFLWCRSESECFLIENSGFIYAQAPYLSGNAFFRFFGGDLSVGDFFLEPKEFVRVVDLRNKLETLDLKLSSFNHDGDNYEFVLSNGAKILMVKDSDFNAAFNNLASAASAEPLDKKLKEELGNLEYLDLRFPNRVVYKFK